MSRAPDIKKRNERVEHVRKMLRLDYTVGDIKRQCSAAWRIRPRAVEKYIRLARLRNHESLNETEDESLSRSLAYWSNMKQQSEALFAKAFKQCEDSEKVIAECEMALQSGAEAAEKLEILEMRKASAIEILKSARTAMFNNRHTSKECQREIDRLKGNHAPIKIARTLASGADLPSSLDPRENLEVAIESIRKFGLDVTMPPLGLPQPESDVVIEGQLASDSGESADGRSTEVEV